MLAASKFLFFGLLLVSGREVFASENKAKPPNCNCKTNDDNICNKVCPAIILANNRTDKLIGLINELCNAIHINR